MESMNSSNERKEQLERNLSVVAPLFNKGDIALGEYEKETLGKVEKNKGEISGRTALVAELTLRKYVGGLEKRNREIESILGSSGNFNRASLEEELQSNNAEIRMISSNCLNTLSEINTNL